MVKSLLAYGRRVLTGFFDNNCSMHAAGLTYFSLLAVIPLLCCVLVLAKACGVDDFARRQINTQIDAAITNIERGQDDTLALLTPQDEADRAKKRIAAEEFAKQARVISNELFARIEAFDIGTLGWIGFGFLLWTLVSSLSMVEMSFNQIWGVPKPRPIWKRALVYLFVLVVLPVLAAVAMSLPILNIVKNIIIATMGATSLTRWASDGLIALLDSGLFRFLVMFFIGSLQFSFLFWLMPNCRVSARHAWWGGMLTAFLFGSWLKLCAVAQIGIAKSSALYGSFALLPIVLAWLYIGWQIILLGAVLIHGWEGESR